MINRKSISILTVLILLLSTVAFAQAQEPVAISYWLWDTNQLPPYQECASQFMAQNPNIQVEIEQLGWNDYWTGITTGFISGEAPDVFTNHLARYPEFVELEQIVDIQPLVERDGVDTGIYLEGLADLWTKDGARYGLPKDWDTVAIVYNVDAVEAAGIDPASLNDLTWNPDDGGTLEEVAAQLTLDAEGRNALDPDFDPGDVEQFGLTTASDGGLTAYGQTEWSYLAASNGFVFNNGLFGDEYFYDDPALHSTIQWIADLSLEKGIAPPDEQIRGLGRLAMFQAGGVAMTFDGSWMIGTYTASDFPVGFARLPLGPEGRKSMFNGLADSIWVGTDHPEESWEWVKFLASPQCELIVGESGVVFPATAEATEASLNVRADAGVDVSAFTIQALEEGGTFFFPITDFAGEVGTIVGEAMDRVTIGEAVAADALTEANEEVNDLFR